MKDAQATLFPREGEVYLDLLSKFGYIFFIYLSGVKMDPKTVLRTGGKAWTIGLLASSVPVITGLIVSYLYPAIVHKYRWPAYQTIITIQDLFPFPVVASMLVDLKIMNTELGRLTLATALICDLMSNLISTIISYIRISQMGLAGALLIHSSVLTILLILFIVFVARPVCLWIVRRTPEGRSVRKFHVILMALLVLVVVLISDNVGLNYQYGPFLLGLLAVPDGPPLGSTLVDKLETFVSGLLTPLLITYCGMKANLYEIFDLQWVAVVWLITLICFTLKWVSIFVPAVVCRVPGKDAAALAFTLCAQGVVQMSFYYYNVVNQVGTYY